MSLCKILNKCLMNVMMVTVFEGETTRQHLQVGQQQQWYYRSPFFWFSIFTHEKLIFYCKFFLWEFSCAKKLFMIFFYFTGTLSNKKKKCSCEKTFFSYFNETFCTLMWHCFWFSHVCQTERRKWFFQENIVNIREGLELLQKGFFYKKKFFCIMRKKNIY